MDIFQLLNTSSVGGEYSRRTKKSINDGIKRTLSWVSKANNVLQSLDEDQYKVLIKNFQSLSNVYQLIDKLSEVLVAYLFLDKKPIFFDDQKGKPDIYLQNSDQYIEVKRINVSDDQKNILEKLNLRSVVITDTSGKLLERKRSKKALLKKAKDFIDEAIDQLNKADKQGVIFLIYSLDLTGYVESVNKREENLVETIKKHFNSLGATKISLKTRCIDEIFQ